MGWGAESNMCCQLHLHSLFASAQTGCQTGWYARLDGTARLRYHRVAHMCYASSQECWPHLPLCPCTRSSSSSDDERGENAANNSRDGHADGLPLGLAGAPAGHAAAVALQQGPPGQEVRVADASWVCQGDWLGSVQQLLADLKGEFCVCAICTGWSCTGACFRGLMRSAGATPCMQADAPHREGHGGAGQNFAGGQRQALSFSATGHASALAGWRPPELLAAAASQAAPVAQGAPMAAASGIQGQRCWHSQLVHCCMLITSCSHEVQHGTQQP